VALYTYAGDGSAGAVNGMEYRGIWFVAKPDYTVMLIDTTVGNDGVKYDST
jgi:hypothetical protein